MLPLHRVSFTSSLAHRVRVQGRNWSRVGVEAASKLHTLRQRRCVPSSRRCAVSAAAATFSAAPNRHAQKVVFRNQSFARGSRMLRTQQERCEPSVGFCSASRHARSASTSTSAPNFDSLRQQLQARSRELVEGSRGAAWWDDTRMILEQLVGGTSTHGHGNTSTQVAADSSSSSQWDMCLKFLSDAREQRVSVPTPVIASLMNEAYSQELWRRCLDLFNCSSVRAGSGGFKYPGRASRLNYVLEKTATATKEEGSDLVSYEMFVVNPFASGSAGDDSSTADAAAAAAADEARLEKLSMFQQAITACRHLEHWGFALEILQACEVLYSAASVPAATAVAGDIANAGAPGGVGSLDDAHLRHLFVGCVCEALFACSSAHEWDRAILVFLRGLEVLDGLDLCAQPALMKEVAYCCGQSGQWSTSLRVLDVVFDAFLQYDEEEAAAAATEKSAPKANKRKKTESKAKSLHSTLIGADGIRQGVAIRSNSYAAALSYSIADVEDLCATMYRNVIKACRNAKQYTLAQQMFEEIRPMYLAHAAVTRRRQQVPEGTSRSPNSTTGQLALPPDPLVFCEMMIAYKEMQRPWDVLQTFSDLMELSFPEYAEQRRVLAARSKTGNARAQLVRDSQQRKSAAAANQGSQPSRHHNHHHHPHGHLVSPPHHRGAPPGSRAVRADPPNTSKPLIASASAIQQLPTTVSTADGRDGRRLWNGAVDARLFRLLCTTHYQLRHWDEVDALFDLMLERGTQPTRLVYNLAISANIKRNDANRAIHLFENMLTHCLQPPSEVTVNALLSCLANAGRTSEILFLFEQLPALEISPNAITLNHMIGAGIAVGDTRLVDRALNQALHAGHPLSSGTLPKLLDCLATPAPGEPFLSVEELERLDQVLNHVRQLGTNTRGDARGDLEQEMPPATNSGSARMRRPAHSSSADSRDATLKLSTDVLHNVVDRNAKGKGQRWRALGDLIGLLVDRHGLRLRGATWNRAVKRLERAVRDAHAGSELSEEAKASLHYVLELRERSS